MGSVKFHKLRAEKANTILKHRQLRKIANLFRFVEAFVVLVLILRFSIQLPMVVKNSSEYFPDFSVFMVSPCFVFVIGNVIVMALLALSGHFSAQGFPSNGSEHDLYQEFIQNSTMGQRIQSGQLSFPEKHSTKTQRLDGNHIKFPEKQIMKPIMRTEGSMENKRIDGNQVKSPEKQIMKPKNSIKSQIIDGGPINFPEKHSIIIPKRIDGNQIKYLEKQSTKPIIRTGDKYQEKQSKKTGDTNMSLQVKVYRRCQTENLSCVQSESSHPVLRRSETEKSRKNFQPVHAENLATTSYPEDGMSNEDFRRTIEAFIDRQQRLRREEECSIN